MLLSTYDRTGKKLTQSVQADNQATATNSYDYDDLNRLKTKKYGDLAEATTYNLQGWIAAMDSDKFSQNLAYTFSGNISTVNWKHEGKANQLYNLAYDAQNRLTAATGNAFEEKGISYDRNGNIKTLQRTANNAPKDDIAYQYNGNQLSAVTGNLASTYTYDVNGNLKTDSRKSLNFDYNYLNLLQAVGTANYVYSADGMKLSVKDGSNGFDYLGSLIVSPSSTEFQFSDGVIMKTIGGYDVNYHLRDHLGSVRVVVDKNNNVLQQNDYYAFGLKQERSDYINNSNRFLYNGKELQTTGDLGLLDYGARPYDPQNVRWFTLDPLAETYYGYSPYNYVMNTPFNAIDPSGTLVIFINGNHGGDGAKGYRVAGDPSTNNATNWRGTRAYWVDKNRRGFDTEVMSHLNDYNAIYRDGALGGVHRTPSVVNHNVRKRYGYAQGKMDAKRVFASLKRDKDGKIVETIKVITHSMGAAYAKGYIRALNTYAALNKITGYIVEYEADFAPYQSDEQEAVTGPNMGFTLQFSHNDDGVAGNIPMKGAIYMNTSGDPNQSHSIFSFWLQIMNLPRGEYKVINGELYKQ